MEPGSLVAGRFEVQALAGQGGMGAVYRALDRETGAMVAVKVLRGYGKHHAERFAREAWVLSELRHPNIVRFVAQGETDQGEGFLAMEWLEGESLAERLAKGPLAIREALVLGAKVAEALSLAHDRRIVHRDLKPGNLFLVLGMVAQVKVLDFGIARVAEPGQTLTVTGTMLGTPGYMSPEQSHGEKDLDGRTDLYSLGCVLFRCLAGRTPFTGEDPLSIALKMVSEPTPRLASLRPDVPPALDDLVARLLAKRREDRPPSAAAALAELNAIAAGAHAAPSLPPPASGAPTRPSVPPGAPSSTPVISIASLPPSSFASQPPLSAPWAAAVTAEAPPAAAPAPAARPGNKLLVAGLVGAVVVLAAAVVLLLVAGGGGQASGPTSDGCPAERCLALRVADPTHVDAVDILPQARQLALSFDRSAELIALNVSTSSGDGTVDVTKPYALAYNFQSKTAMIQVSNAGGRLVLNRFGGQHAHVVTDPVCTAKAAFRTAVSRGAPRTGTLQLILADVEPGSGQIWMVIAAGQSFVVDGHTCAARR